MKVKDPKAYIETLFTIIDGIVELTSFDEKGKKDFRNTIADTYKNRFLERLTGKLTDQDKAILEAMLPGENISKEAFEKVMIFLSTKVKSPDVIAISIEELERVVKEMIYLVHENVPDDAKKIFDDSVKKMILPSLSE